ncbi:UNVERIFIED_CONTAM: protein ALWAYS EARLY 3 [Sesamum calycinum]|uniref:Protein ALWAYS EARLY 3 n=1 Tax=Sesamum calycinum TaxID=2727403 RepID=A0AAW2QK11_9LAMI
MDELGSLPLVLGNKLLSSISGILVSSTWNCFCSGLIAMMTDHYSNLAGSDSDQESNDGAGSSRKTQKRARGKVQPTTSKATDEQLVSHSQTVASNYGCLSLLKKKRSGGTRPCPVGKRTPRFPVSFSYENINGEGYVSPTKQGMKLKASGNDDEVAHEIAIALAEASQRVGSPQVSRTPGRRAESVTSSPFRHAQRKHSLVEMPNSKILDADMDEEDLEGSTEGDTDELSGCKPSMKESISIGAVRKKVRKLEGKKFDVEYNSENQFDDIKEECSGTEESQRFSATQGKLDAEVTNTQISRSSMQNHGKKTKKVLFRRDEAPAFEALQTLADLSLMMPTENEDDPILQFKDEGEDNELVSSENPPLNQQKEKRRSSGIRTKGHQSISICEVASSKASKPGKASVLDISSIPEENQDPHQSISKTRKKQKMQMPKIQKTEAHSDVHLSESPGVEAGDVGKKLMINSKKSSQSGSPNLMKNSENSSTVDLRKEASDSAQSAVQVPVVNQKKLSNCLSNPHLRRWCTYEWFYSAIDYPWFAKREFVEYLYHVGLGHVPRLTRVEWGVIRSSLGKPRRFSEQFLKEEKEKLNQYRDSVRKHYTELREGVREGLPTDLARPLSVGQRVIAIHPKTREIHDGSVLTVDHARCRVQFDRHELGVEFVMDIDCMPLNPFENMPALLGAQPIAVDKFFENFNELKINGRAQDFMKLYSGDNVDNADGISELSPLANRASSSNLTKFTLTRDNEFIIEQEHLKHDLVHQVASVNTNMQTRIGSAETAGYQQTAYCQPTTLAQIQAKEADVQALAELTRALDKSLKVESFHQPSMDFCGVVEAIVLELRQMNNDVLETQKDGGSSLKDSEPFKKQYAAVLIQLNEANEQVSSALYCLRQRNTYQGTTPLACPRPGSNLADPGGELSSCDRSACQNHDSGSHANEIINSSRTKARAMVDAAVQAMSSLKSREHTIEKIEEAIDYVNDQLPSDDSSTAVAPDPKPMTPSDVESHIPSELISKCVATLLMIQKCTERQFPPSDVAQILDSAVTSLQPRSPQNLAVYTEIQKCMGIIRNQIMALIPT